MKTYAVELDIGKVTIEVEAEDGHSAYYAARKELVDNIEKHVSVVAYTANRKRARRRPRRTT